MSATPEAMPTVAERVLHPTGAAPAPQPPGQPLRLMLTAAAAARQVAPYVAKGVAIRKHRLRDLADLDKARVEKRAWVEAYGDLLARMFDGPAVAEACNDWVGRVLPEYAPLGLFVEQFYEEMDHRLRRLQAVVDHLEDMAVEDAPAGGAAGQAAAAAPARKDEPKGKSLNWARLFPTAEELSGKATGIADFENPAPVPAPAAHAPADRAGGSAKPQPAGAAKSHGHTPPGTLPPVVKPVGLLLAQSADEARAVCEFLADLAVTPRVMTPADAKSTDGKSADPESLMAGATPPGFALVWPGPADPPDPAAAARFQFQLGFLVGRLGLSRVCLVQPAGKPPPADGTPVATITLDAHGGWQLPLARTLKRAGVQVDLNRLC